MENEEVDKIICKNMCGSETEAMKEPNMNRNLHFRVDREEFIEFFDKNTKSLNRMLEICVFKSGTEWKMCNMS